MRLPLATAATLLLLAAPALAADGTGGAVADEAAPSLRGSGALAYGTPPPPRPVARVFRLAEPRVAAGTSPAISLRIDHPDARRVRAQVAVWSAARRRTVVRIDVGGVATGRTVRVRWPRSRRLGPGRYVVRLHVQDPGGRTLLRGRRTSGRAALTVVAPPEPKPKPRPEPRPAPPARRSAFPVAGAWAFGGAGSGFGAARKGHRHEGQDITASEGVPVVSVMPGTVTTTAYQEGGAGEYVVVHHDDGRATFYAHCRRGSTAVRVGARVGAGSRLCAVGSTGASSGPHLHFELWTGGWRDRGGRPVDPLGFLRSLR